MKGLHKIRQKWNDSKLGRNDISVRIYLSFVVVLAVSLLLDRKSTRLNSSHIEESRMPSSA